MPIPPRPIPTPTPSLNSKPGSRPRPGSSVPRKSLAHSQLLPHLEWRSEVALLGDLPRSAPSHSAIRLVSRATAMHEKAETEKDRGGALRREVGIEGMIVEGKGRVKRGMSGLDLLQWVRVGMMADCGIFFFSMVATTATALGFDFVVNPCVLVLPDNPTSLLTASKGMTGTISPALSNTPNTPALLPTHPTEEEDDGWEHVPSSPLVEAEVEVEVGDDREDQGEDVIVLGEMEFEEVEAVDREGETSKGEVVSGRKVLSYAAVLGARKV
ncbi:MAG: hypothetical protein TREMPRED_000974 [Tremellales sp. Tagirdzhanova-0007]|nr:MAG: hypothetical protein TREMPRED_000974 [Tremellales sp. Tagirdzhanova-0007]